MRIRSTLAVIAVLGSLAVFTPNAGAVTFGADLSAPANSTGTCALFNQNSCTLFSGLPGPGFYAPASGTVDSISVKTPNVPQGPMQVVVMRSLYQNKAGDPGHPYFACCFVQEYGPIFTPAAGTISTIPTSLTMVEDPTPPADNTTTNARGDFLALSVLTGNVPIPANQDGVSNYSCIYPAPNPQTHPAPAPNPILVGSCGVGYHVMLAANLNPGGGGGGSAVPQGSPLQFPSGGSLVGTTASIPVTCVLTTACEGLLRLTNQAGAAARKKVKTYGRKKYSIPAGKTKRIRIKLNKAGKKKARSRKSVRFNVTTKIGGKNVSGRVKFTRPKKK